MIHAAEHLARPFVTIVLDQPAIGPEWKSWLTYELALRGFSLELDGTLLHQGETVGLFQFLDDLASEELLRAMNIEASARECPWAGPVRGAIGWELLGVMEDLHASFLPSLFKLAQGPVIRIKDAVHYEPVRKVGFSLYDLSVKSGFDDGGAFLNDSSEYLEYARREAQLALARAGLEADVSIMDNTAHNPLRIWGPVTRRGKKVSEHVLRDFSMTLWAYDWSCLEEIGFWYAP